GGKAEQDRAQAAHGFPQGGYHWERRTLTNRSGRWVRSSVTVSVARVRWPRVLACTRPCDLPAGLDLSIVCGTVLRSLGHLGVTASFPARLPPDYTSSFSPDRRVYLG